MWGMCTQKICTLEYPNPFPCIVICTYHHPQHSSIIILKNAHYSPFSMLLHSMEQSPSWEANIYQELPCILWETKVHYRFHNSPTLVLIYSQVNPILVSPNLTSWRSILILSFHTPRPSNWPLSLKFPHQNPVCTNPLLHTCHLHPPLSFLLSLITRLIFGGEYRSWSC